MRLALLLALVACGGHQGRPDYPTPEEEAAAARAGRPAASPPPVRAGEVERARLDEILAAGPGALLSRVRVEAVAQGGKFHGWRILSLPPDPRVELEPGDVVLRVNGQGLERPEHLARVFESLRGAGEVAVDYERRGEPRTWRLAVVER